MAIIADLKDFREPVWIDNLIFKPTQLPMQWCDASCALVHGVFYMAGGYTVGHVSTKVCYKYDVETNQYTRLTDAPVAMSAGAIFVWAGGDYIFLLQSTSVYKYSISGNSWTGPLAACPHVLGSPVAAYNLNGDGNIHYFNGDPVNPRHEIYDPIANSWTVGGGPVPPSPTGFSTLGVRNDGRIVIVGGTPAPAGNTAMIYDPVGLAWTVGLTAFPTDPETGLNGLRYGSPRENPVFGNKLYIVSGQLTAETSDFSPRCYIYDMVGDTYTEIAPINGLPRDGSWGTFYRNQLFVFGGRYSFNYIGGSIAVDILTVMRNQSKYQWIWSPSDWSFETFTAFDPGGTVGPALPYWLAWYTKGGDEYLYQMTAKVITPGVGGAVGRVYDLYNNTTTTTIQSITIAPAGAVANIPGLDKKIGAKTGDVIVLRAVSDDGATKAANINVTLRIIKVIDRGMMART